MKNLLKFYDICPIYFLTWNILISKVFLVAIKVWQFKIIASFGLLTLMFIFYDLLNVKAPYFLLTFKQE